MATKAKTLQVKDKEKDDKAADAPEKDSADAPSPLLDLSDAAVKKMIKQAKKRGFVTFDQLNEVLPSDTTSPEQIEDIMSMLSDMGINVSEAEEADAKRTRIRPRTIPTTSLSRLRRRPSPRSRSPSPASVPTIPCACTCARWAPSSCSPREGEIAIAKTHRGRREAMIAGLCESPLTFQAIIIWRDELNEGKIFLRDIHRSRSHLRRPRRQGRHDPNMIGAVGPDGPADRCEW
jgi:RNA polymerase primary sigma factor